MTAKMCVVAVLMLTGASGLHAESPPSPPLVLAQVSVQDPQRDVRLIKTAYLYNFLKFVRWPPSSGAGDIKVCIARDAELARIAQDALRGKRVADRPVQVAALESESAATGCGLLYAAQTATRSNRPGSAANVLTVGEGRAFVESGGMIGFTVVDDRVRFFVNLKALRDAGLSADARLLTVAIEVLQ